MSSPGFCLETLLEAAKFVELQEQQQQQQKVVVIASGSAKLASNSVPGPLHPVKTEVIPLKGKRPIVYYYFCCNNNIYFYFSIRHKKPNPGHVPKTVC